MAKYRDEDWQILFDALERSKAPLVEYWTEAPRGAAGYLGTGNTYTNPAPILETTTPILAGDGPINGD